MIIIIKIFGMLYKILTTRMIGLDGMRLVAMITPALSLCLSISSLSIQTVCNQDISRNLCVKTKRISVIMLSALKITLTSSSIISICMLLSFPIYKYIYQESFIYYPLLLCIPLIYFSNISGVIKGYLEANNKFEICYLSNVIESLVKILGTVLLLIIFKEHSIKTKCLIIFFGLMLSELSSNIYLSYKIIRNRKIKFIQTDSYEKTLLKQAIPLTLSQLVITISGYITPFIFYYAASKIGISIYDSTTYYALVASYALPLLINGEFATLTITKFIFPSITKSIDDKDKQNKLLDKSFYLNIIVATISTSACFFYAKEILSYLYDDSSSAIIVKSLSLIFFFIYFDPILVTILQSYKKGKSLLFISIISQLSAMILIYLLTTNIHIKEYGYAIGLTVGLSIKCILLFIFAFKTSKYKPNITNLLIILTISISFFTLNYLFNNFIYFVFLSIAYALIALLCYYYLYNNKEHHLLNKKHIKSY